MDPEFGPALAAIVTGDLAELQALLAADPTLAGRRSSCSHPTLLQMVAVDAKKLPDPVGAARVLVEAGAPLAEPLVAAASVDAREVLRFLLDRGAEIDGDPVWRPLDEALYWRHLELARVLVDWGAAVRTLRASAGLGEVARMEPHFEGGTLRADAGAIGSPWPDLVPPERANDPQDILDNAFVLAAQNGSIPAASWLLERGARLNACPPGYHWKGCALHAAAWRGDRTMVEWLLSQGADRSIRDGMVGGVPAGWARHHGHEGLAVFLESGIEAGEGA